MPGRVWWAGSGVSPLCGMDREIRTGHANVEEMRVREEGEKYDFCGYVNRKTASQRVKRIHTTWTLRSFSFFLNLLSELLFDYLMVLCF